MTEPPERDKAGELVNDLLQHPLSEEEAATLRRPYGELKLGPDMQAVELDGEATRVQDVVRSRLRVLDIVALSEPDAGVVGIVVPVEAYLRMVRHTANSNLGPGALGVRDDGLLAPWHVQEIGPNDPETPGQPLTE